MIRFWLAGLIALAPPSTAQSFWSVPGRLEATDPTYRPAQLVGPDCQASALDVPFDVHELVLGAGTELRSDTCGCADFDTVVALYRRPDGGPGAFDPADPCRHLVVSDDNACGVESIVAAELEPGHVDVVVTTALVDVGLGRYATFNRSDGTELRAFVFYSGFEPGDLRTWSVVVDGVAAGSQR